jgi:hypothetical protein
VSELHEGAVCKARGGGHGWNETGWRHRTTGKIAKNLFAADKLTSQREKVNKHDRIVIKIRTKKERIRKLGIGIWMV